MTDPNPHGCTIGGQPAMPILISEYNQLTADLAALRAVARGYCPACGRGDAAPSVTDWEQQKQRAAEAEREATDTAAAAALMVNLVRERAEHAEAAVARVRRLANEHPVAIDTALIHAALAGEPGLHEPAEQTATEATDGQGQR